ncbi:glutathione S-transferase [Nitrospirillum sp. BR 11164]|uniref:glutathione S-transferase family protein n=1 Tax=Nitrospirillum sp. BR 11164 TaxID=3104324 RepID=UPI002AFE3C6C|nr:glutathione S-transferase [Nitrospirillum sp. BR 11164]MEA1652057.1 glutathione S-transferase [Nitrospirillum sp. BR 11164]
MPAHSAAPLVIYGTPLSGHVHRVQLLLRMLGLPHEFVEAGAAVRATAEFRALNPLGQIPVLVDGDVVVPDSNASLLYLAKRYDQGGTWLPEEPAAAARVQRWLSVAAGEVRHGPASARMVVLWNLQGHLPLAREISARLLPFMDQHLADRRWLADEAGAAMAHPTIADLACYSYVAHAPEGGISLDGYEHLNAWLRRVEALPAFQAMPASPLASPKPAA